MTSAFALDARAIRPTVARWVTIEPIVYPPPCRYKITASLRAPGGVSHSAAIDPIVTGSHSMSDSTLSLTFSIPERRRSTVALGSPGRDLSISRTFCSSWLAISRPPNHHDSLFERRPHEPLHRKWGLLSPSLRTGESASHR